jgi:UDP-GlcNAc:undecaprenyl-phosphate GlcNAc-1-phosphate transferase
MIAFMVSIFSTIFFKKLAVKYKIYDEPKSNIKTHKTPIPYLGGLAIAFSFFFTLIIIRLFTHFETGTLRNLWGIFLAGFLILIIGLIDDLKDLNFKIKIFFQFIVATILILFGMKIQFISPDYLAIIFTYLWIIGIINAINLIDIMDGLSSGITIIACLAFFFINSTSEAYFVNFAAIALCGACFGFLKFNFNPASIFMGDTGSLFIGSVLAAISLGANYSGNNEIAIFSPILILIVPIYDTFYISYKRIQKGKSIFIGSKDHIALRLNFYGFSIKKTVLILYIFSIFFSLLAFFIVKTNFKIALIIYIITLIVSLIIGNKLGKIIVED